MKIYELIKELNKKSTVKASRVMELKKLYLSIYRAYMVMLYDKGFVADPTVFNERELLRNIVELKIPHLIGVDGRVQLNEDYIEYAKSQNKGNAEIYEFLDLLSNVVKYRNISLNIDKFYDDNKYNDKDKCKVGLELVQSASRIFTKNGFKIDEGALKCFMSKDINIKFVSLNDKIYEAALNELGIEDNSDDSLFVSGISKEDEISSAKLILNGLVKLDGVYAKKLTDWLEKNKWADGNTFTADNQGLYNWILIIKSNNMIEYQSYLLNKLLDEGKVIVGMQSDGFYIIDEESPLVFPIGSFAVLSDDVEETVLPIINKLEGYTGEVYSMEYLHKHNMNYSGSPIELFIDNKNKGLFVDKEQTELKDAQSWFSFVQASLSFGESEYVEGVFSTDSLEDKLFKMVGDSESCKMIGYLSNNETGKVLESAKKVVGKKLMQGV